MKRFMKWPLLCGLLGLTLARPVQAADDSYTNSESITYPGTEQFPPVIDATNFYNTGTFIINFTFATVTASQPFYETSDTLNYVNTGLMMGNFGFRFDNQPSGSGTRTPSASFINEGTVSCGSTNNTTDSFFGLLGITGFFIPQCIVSATNIVNPGDMVVGVDGLLQLTGKNVDLSRGTFNVEGGGANGGSANAFGTGIFDLNTNFWDPSVRLTATNAISAGFAIAPFVLALSNSTAYFDSATPIPGYNIIRSVFIQDNSGAGVSNNVYFDTGGIGFGGGNVTIEWIGTYQDPATGNSLNNFLYLNNNYVLGSSTNVFLFNGFPINFRFVSSGTSLLAGLTPPPTPAAPGFLSVFPNGSISNSYAFANVQLTSTTVDTNLIPNLSITNLPGRIEISAADELNLAYAQITGANYLSIQSPHQFDGSQGAVIQSPFSDINVGVTNGFLTISNLMSSGVANWSGNVQAWSTRWIAVDTAAGVTNDFRVLIVGSRLNPTTMAQVQNLIMHGTNSIVISDTFNVMRSFTADAQNLTLTTNGPGVGATSLQGELNINAANVFSWPNSLPNLRNLTNNGALRFQNLAQFNGNSNSIVVTPGMPALAAQGLLSEVAGRTNVMVGNKVLIGTNVYAFQIKLTNALANQVKLAKTFDGSMSNLIAAINRTVGAGTTYSSATVTNPLVTAGKLTNHSFTVTAKMAGVSGNSIQTINSVQTTNLTWNGHTTLYGGADPGIVTTNAGPAVPVPYANFINSGWVSGQGSTIWADNFVSSGVISNYANGSFALNSLTTTLTNGSVLAGGDISITANSLVTSNVLLVSGRSITLRATNLLTDTGVTNGSVWTVQSTNGSGGNGLIMPVKPALGDLLGTTITNNAAGPNKQVINMWAGQDRGVSVNGYTNNEAVGRLILDAFGTTSLFKFAGASISNALYVDYLEFRDAMTNGINNSFDFSPNLQINTNLVIYFAQAVANGNSIAAKIDEASKAGRNGGRLRWVPAYVGYFSSVTLVYPDGTTNVVNGGLAASSAVDSDGDGTANATDPSPFFTGAQINLSLGLTNTSPMKAVIKWSSIPGATNYVYYRTNLASPVWLTLTNFVSPSIVPPVGGWPITNTLFDVVNPVQPRFYNIKVTPSSTLLYGP